MSAPMPRQPAAFPASPRCVRPERGLRCHQADMLRLTVTTCAEGTTLLLEGRLCGAWVDELATCWRGVLARHDAGTIRVDLDGVTFVDAAGKALIRALRDQGAILLAT